MDVPHQRRLGRYEIQALLGAGGMGEVYLAHDTNLRREVAIKVLPAHLAGNGDGLRRLEKEAHAASSLNHPNILTVYEIGTQDGTAFIAAEFIDGESLRLTLSLRRRHQQQQRSGNRPINTATHRYLQNSLHLAGPRATYAGY